MTSRAAVPFAQQHPADRDAVAAGIALCWFFLLSGFLLDMVRALGEGHHYVPAAHFHAASAVAWLALLSWQALKVRAGRLADHRRHGRQIGGWLAAFVVVSALVTMWTADQAHLAQPGYNPATMAFQLGHVIPFVVFTALALTRTDQPALHKRLLLLAVFAVLDTGWSRWVGHEIAMLSGDGWAGLLLRRYPATWLMLAAMALYDWSTRGRLHPAFVPATALIVATQAGAVALYFTPAWGALARHALGG